MELPKVAAVIASHNYGKWIVDCVRSVEKQTYPKHLLSICVCDDGSSDDTADKLRSITRIDYEENNFFVGNLVDSNIRIYVWRNDEPKGPSTARNLIIRNMIEGGFAQVFGVLDADDEWLPTKVEKCVDKLLSNGYLGSVYTDYDTLNEFGVKTRVFNDSYSYELLLVRCCVHSGVFIKKEVFEAIGYYDESLRTCEDYDFHLRTAEKFIIGHVPEALSIVRVGSHNSTSTVAGKVWQENHAKVFEKLRQRQCR